MNSRPSLSRKKRIELWELHKGICHICNQKIDGSREAWEIEHVIPREMHLNRKDADTDENMQLAHVKCHKVKTRQDVKNLTKAKSRQAKHFGYRAPSKTPMPFGKNSIWKKCFDGSVINRNTGEVRK